MVIRIATNGEGLQRYAMRDDLCVGAYCCKPVLGAVVFIHR